MKVCIVGAGASGLAAIKACLDSDLDPVCFEKTGDIGGYWKFMYSEGDISVYSSCVSKTSKELHAYSQFPPPAEWPNFWHHTRMLKYLRAYSKKFCLDYYIRRHCMVTKIVKAKDYGKSGRYDVTYNDRCKQATMLRTETFDAVFCCSGRPIPVTCDIIGNEHFIGFVGDCLRFKDAGRYSNETVVVNGNNQTAIDIACDLCRVCKKVYIAVDQPFKLVRCLSNGRNYPADLQAISVANSMKTWWRTSSSASTNNLVVFDDVNVVDDKMETVLSDELAFYMLSDRIKIKPSVTRFDTNGTTVHFSDSTVAHHVDSFLSSFGSVADLSYISDCVGDVNVPLLMHMFMPNLPHSNLCIIGQVNPKDYGSMLPLSEMQCRLACEGLLGKFSMRSLMLEYQKSSKNDLSVANAYEEQVSVDYVSYMHDLAWRVGCEPPYNHSFFHSLSLARALWFGPLVSYQFRLRGPNSDYKSAYLCTVNVNKRVKMVDLKKSDVSRRKETLATGNRSWLARRVGSKASKMIVSIGDLITQKQINKSKRKRNLAAMVMLITVVSVTVYQIVVYVFHVLPLL